MKCTECVLGLRNVTKEFCTTCHGRGGWDDGDPIPAELGGTPTNAPAPVAIVDTNSHDTHTVTVTAPAPKKVTVKKAK